jgi:hypothetical protein
MRTLGWMGAVLALAIVGCRAQDRSGEAVGAEREGLAQSPRVALEQSAAQLGPETTTPGAPSGRDSTPSNIEGAPPSNNGSAPNSAGGIATSSPLQSGAPADIMPGLDGGLPSDAGLPDAGDPEAGVPVMAPPTNTPAPAPGSTARSSIGDGPHLGTPSGNAGTTPRPLPPKNPSSTPGNAGTTPSPLPPNNPGMGVTPGVKR